MILSKNFCMLILLCLGFVLLTTSFWTAKVLAGKIMEDNDYGNLGFYSLAVCYLAMGISSMFATPIVRRLGTIKSLFLGAFAQTLFVASYILPCVKALNPDMIIPK